MAPTSPASSCSLSNRATDRNAKGTRQGPFFLERRARYEALATRFDLMHCVQTRIRFTTPFTTTRTRCRLGYQRRGVLLFAWLTLCPVMGPLPQISHTRAIDRSDDNEFQGRRKEA